MTVLYNNILSVLIANGIPQHKASMITTEILHIINLSEDNTKAQRQFQHGCFVSIWSDGSEFRSNCIVDLPSRICTSIEMAGFPNDDAICVHQFIEIEGIPYRVYDPEVDEKESDLDIALL